MTSQDYQNQLAQMGDMPNFKQNLAQLYENPVLRPLVNEAAQLESQYLPSLFRPFTEMGTEASDMSPAAKLAMIGGSLGRLGGKINANNSIQNFYGMQIDNLANLQNQQWQQRQQNLKDLYQMSFQREEAERAERARQQQLAEARASRAAMSAGAFPGMPQMPAAPKQQQLQLPNNREHSKRAITAVNQLQGLARQPMNAQNNAIYNNYIKELQRYGYDTRQMGLQFRPVSQNNTGGGLMAGLGQAFANRI